MKATLINNQQTPRKTRLVANLVKGKKVDEALTILSFLPRRSASEVAKLIRSAAANAAAAGASREQLYIKSLTVNKGLVLKRLMPRAHGRASRINRRLSHLSVVLGEKSATSPQTK